MLKLKILITILLCVYLGNVGLAQKLFFSENDVIKTINFNGTGLQALPGSGGRYLSVDAGEGYLFYSNTQEIYRSALDGSGETQIGQFYVFAGYAQMDLVPDDQQIIYVGVNDDQDDLWLGSFYDTPSDPQTNIKPAPIPEEDFTDVSFNRNTYNLYFSDVNGNIYESDLGATFYQPLVSNFATGPLSVDYKNNVLYYVQRLTTNYEIVRLNLTTFASAVVWNNGNNEIISLDVYPELNTIFFAQYDGLFKVSYTGTGHTNIYSGSNLGDMALAYDITSPVFTALSPANGATDVFVNSDLSMTFSENVKVSTTSGTANETSIRIFQTTGNVLVQTIPRASTDISITNNVVTISGLTTPLYNTDYYVLVGNKVFSDDVSNDFIGIVFTTGWTFKTQIDESKFYSRQSGNWDSPATWSHLSHTGPAATLTPGTGSDVVIGNGHTVTLTSTTGVVANTTGTTIASGGILDAASYELEVWGALTIDGQLINGGVLSGVFDLYATSGIPVFNEIHYGISEVPGSEANIHTHVVALNGIQSVSGGTINTNGFQICVPPTPSPTVPVFSNITQTSITLSWTAGGGQAFVVGRAGSTAFKPQFGQAYTANAAFGTGSAIGTGNFLVYSGSGNTVTITGLTAGTYYEFDLYSYSTSIGGCYSVQNYQLSSATSCIVLPAPSGAVNAQYCTGDAKPTLNVNSPGVGKKIRWYDAPTGGNIAPGNSSGGDGLGGVFLPNAPSGTFYAETYDETLLCSSATRTAVTLTLHPPLLAGTPSANQNICSGGDPTAIDGGTASGGTGAYTYHWESASASAGPYSSVPGALGTTYDPPSGITQTTYYRRVTRSATCLQPGNPVMINVITTPVITAQPTPQQACDGLGATFSINATGTSLNYQWQADLGAGYVSLSNGGVYSGATTNQLQISNSSGLNNVRYQCIVTTASACPVTSAAVPIIVNTRPVANNQAQSFCENVAGSGLASIDLTSLNPGITGGAGGVTVAWFTNSGLTTPVANATNVAASNNTIFYARVTNTSTGCVNSATAGITVNVKPSGSGIISGALALCSNSSSTYTITGISNALRYQWQVSSGLQIESQSNTSAVIKAVSGTSETITVTGENSCSTGGNANLTIQVLPTPVINIVAPVELGIDEPASFSFEPSNTSFKSVLWDFGDNATSNEASTQHQYAASGDFQVTLTLQDDSNCEATDAVTIKILPLPELSDFNIKNVITANGDSQNGFLYIENIEKYPSNEVVLLDRWGVQVFRKDNYVNDWDARNNGEFLPAGQYVCVVKINDTGKVLSRTVSIIKRK
ncbi:gliding motility-associated C-terminal domain-containing protein [Chryseolinea sp. H1M3-3]|uniref:T9SS type B sorting domain-containing protein n=1 Tax=Chryseolinea sp. H1M3-3 TaxID=3034144 RepID=UPI0023EA8711|nr:gliding motility-associated C-terminal domain-containing protein [Chryseolinea sp. H1M3-3]